MSQSLSKLYIHIVFHTKGNTTLIRTKDSDQLYSYIAGILKKHDSIPIQINGTDNHIHILCVMSKNIALATLVQQIKASSSGWLKTLDDYYREFAWQKGYAGFSVSPSVHEKTSRYILNQQEHHKKMSFRDELLMFFKKYRIEYDERYLWLDD
ncbi:transposase [Dysgonomonas sp. 511]|uniref:transposase n=1 Tax=Dysgonomonas sp. 511 TaxID=2302930 RepID=UPI0013D8AC71|nr:transposase [Dysgonomonas sp. 511]NDV77667.1 transposase [Dysgonomonas sp. 511]